MSHNNMNHGHHNQKNLNMIFGIVLVVLIIAVSYLVGLVHISYRNELMKERVNQMMLRGQ